MLYFFLAIGPTAADQASDYMFNSGNRSSQTDEEDDWSLADEELIGPNGEYISAIEIGTIFDPDGAAIPSAANLTPSDKPEVSLNFAAPADAIRLHRSGQIYVTSFTHSFFDGLRWTTPNAESKILTPSPDGLIHLRQSDQPPTFRYSVFHGRLSDGQNTVKTLQGAQNVRLLGITKFTDGTWLLPERHSGYFN